jgi:hypothetical protein
MEDTDERSHSAVSLRSFVVTFFREIEMAKLPWKRKENYYNNYSAIA